MFRAARFLAFGIHLSVCRALVCPAQFTYVLGVCLHFPAVKMNYCDSQAYCSSVNGELVRGSSYMALDGRTFSGMPQFYWIGLTDFLAERGTQRSGWRWTDGTIDPSSSTIAWNSAQPSTSLPDCVRSCYASDELCNSGCAWKYIPMCMPRPQLPSATRIGTFRSVSIPVGLPAEDFAQNGGCSKLLVGVESAIECAALCSKEEPDWCASFYFSEARRECRLVLYTDATIDVGSDSVWRKFAMNK